MKRKIIVTRKLPESVEQRLARDYDAVFNPEDKLFTSEDFLKRCEGADAVFACHTDKLSAEVFEGLPETVKIIGNMSVGVDHVDLDAAKKHGVAVTNTPEVLNDATAEITMLLILGAARRASEGERLIRSGGWSSWSPNFMIGTQVTGKRLGIVGMGGVGRITAQRARGFDMRIHYHNRSRLSGDREQGAVYHQRLEEMLPLCDFLAVHCPSSAETENLMNEQTFSLLPDGAIFVNAARGNIVDEGALIKALNSGKLAAAGLDVFRNEPHINPEFFSLDNVFLLPHIGSATSETRNAMGYCVVDNIDAFFAGSTPPNQIA